LEFHPTIHKEPACQRAFLLSLSARVSARQQFACHRVLERVLIYVIEVTNARPPLKSNERFPIKYGLLFQQG
jgi:hypothetical protein